MTPEQILQKAKDRDYSQNAMSADKSWYAMSSDRCSLALELYPKTDEFVLSYFHGILRLSTDKCGSFSNDEHFRKFERMMIKAIRLLRD